jgi:hypothetical protein
MCFGLNILGWVSQFHSVFRKSKNKHFEKKWEMREALYSFSYFDYAPIRGNLLQLLTSAVLADNLRADGLGFVVPCLKIQTSATAASQSQECNFPSILARAFFTSDEVLAKLGQNARECGSSRKSSPTGAKAPLILSHLLARLKPCPCYKARTIEYFGKLTEFCKCR